MNLKYYGPLSDVAFNCNLRHYNEVQEIRNEVGRCRLTLVSTVDPTLAFRGFQRLKLKHDIPVSDVAFNFNLRFHS